MKYLLSGTYQIQRRVDHLTAQADRGSLAEDIRGRLISDIQDALREYLGEQLNDSYPLLRSLLKQTLEEVSGQRWEELSTCQRAINATSQIVATLDQLGRDMLRALTEHAREQLNVSQHVLRAVEEKRREQAEFSNQIMEEIDHLGKERRPRDCADVFRKGSWKTGEYMVYPDDGGDPFWAFCDMDTTGGGWTVRFLLRLILCFFECTTFAPATIAPVVG